MPNRWAVQRARYITLETIAPISDNPIVILPALQPDQPGSAGHKRWLRSSTTHRDAILDEFRAMERPPNREIGKGHVGTNRSRIAAYQRIYQQFCWT
jgi:hypothetical protein